MNYGLGEGNIIGTVKGYNTGSIFIILSLEEDIKKEPVKTIFPVRFPLTLSTSAIANT